MTDRSRPKIFNRFALEHGCKTIDQTHDYASVDEDVDDPSIPSLRDRRVAQQREANGNFGPDHGEAV